jgi:hypothetical protein
MGGWVLRVAHLPHGSAVIRPGRVLERGALPLAAEQRQRVAVEQLRSAAATTMTAQAKTV